MLVGAGRADPEGQPDADAARQAIERIAGRGSWPPAELELLVEKLLVDPERFSGDSDFRARVVARIAAALPSDAPAELRDRLLLALSARLDLHDLATVETGWRAAERGLTERLAGTSGAPTSGAPAALDWPELRLGPPEAPIGLSIYSLASPYFSAAEATAFLGAVRRSAPKRALVVLTDYPQSRALADSAAELGVHLSQTWSRVYSPWPRDPMSFLVRPDGAQVAVLRPNRQPGREADSAMALELIQDLPTELDTRFGPLTWTPAPIPFHNGQLLPAGDLIWLSIHSLEPRILELLRIDRVPVESFAKPEGVRDYLEAARLAAGEVELLFGSPVRFVHPLPDSEQEGVGAAMQRLGGGAGFDLDSLITLLPHAAAGPAALVGDLAAGVELVAESRNRELGRLAGVYGLGPDPDGLRSAIRNSHARPRATRLSGFLDLVAEHLGTSGFAVHRAPLLLVPTSLVEVKTGLADEDFLVGWNNVVLQSEGDDRRAEGFAAELERGDRLARDLFARLGYRLELFPPLVGSVLRNGGYRCASNHLREPPTTEARLTRRP